MNLLIAQTKCALVYKRAGGDDWNVSTLNAIYYIGRLHPWWFHKRRSDGMVRIMWREGYVQD